MARTARGLGHDYMVLTDHSPRLTVAHGLSRERLEQQLADVAVLNEKMAPFRILTGIEVDILEDGTLDHDDEVLGQLDVVVASVHSKLRMERQPMTERMVRAVASPHVDILGHCTGRMIGKRDPSTFDADYVFAACAAVPHRRRDQLPAGTARPATPAARPGHRVRLLLRHRLRRPRHGPTRMATARLQPGGGVRGAARPGHQHLGGRTICCAGCRRPDSAWPKR